MLSQTFRKFDVLFRALYNEEDIGGVAVGCLKPCHYNRYSFVGGSAPSNMKTGDTLLFSLWAVSNNVFTETEQLVYPWTSLVAEFGGVLGLFLGFSFMMIWDGVEKVFMWARTLKAKQAENKQCTSL